MNSTQPDLGDAKQKNRAYAKTYREKKKARGLCIWGGCNAPASAAYCAEHKERVGG